jgi:hypothetical protein
MTTMKSIRSLLVWVWRTWPAIILCIVGALHYALIHCLSLPPDKVTKLFSLFTQLGGGAVVLYSVDTNIGVFRKSSLRGILKQYLKECPIPSRNVTVGMSAVSAVSASGIAALTTGRNPQTIDDKLAYLQEQIDGVKAELMRKVGEISTQMQKITAVLRSEIYGISTSLNVLESKVVDTVVGGIKQQIFGLLLVVYGAIADYSI